MRNSANTAGSREGTVGFNLLPYEMQPGKILPGSTPLARPGERGREKHPMSPLSSAWELLTYLSTVSYLSSVQILPALENQVTWKTRKK